jgi:outer membrane protein OmpA-like peptidoglycan-associated protein
MIRSFRLGWVLVALVALVVTSLAPGSNAGLGDKLKKKAQDKANKTANDAVNKADPTADKKEGEEASGEASSTGKAEAPEGGEEKVSSVSTKFDYVPGDMVLFFDDFTQDELGEFPANWKLTQGTLEVAEMNGQRWLRSTSIESRFGMKLPAAPALPEFWTLELDFYCGEPSGNVLNVSALKGDKDVWTTTFPYSGQNTYFESGEVTSNTPLENSKVWGEAHHIMFMARGTALKVYVDRQRVANVPEIDPKNGPPDNFVIWLWSDKEPMITNVRYAEGNKPVADPFANGKLVTYGIYFDSASDVVKAESAPVLRQIAAYMEKNPAVKVQILGHTDNQGTPDGNLDLSKRRAASVAKVLSDQFKIAADRFTTDGMGDTKAVADNAKAEGRAMNRRVEFTKL